MNIYKNNLDSISCHLQSFQTPSSSDDVRQQRDLELDEVRNARWKNITPRTKELSRGNQRLTTEPFRKSWCPPDESELSFNKVDQFYIWAFVYFECFRFPSQRRCQIDWRLHLYTATTRSAKTVFNNQSNKCACYVKKQWDFLTFHFFSISLNIFLSIYSAEITVGR